MQETRKVESILIESKGDGRKITIDGEAVDLSNVTSVNIDIGLDGIELEKTVVDRFNW